MATKAKKGGTKRRKTPQSSQTSAQDEMRAKLTQLSTIRMTLANVRQTQSLLTQAMSTAEERVKDGIARLEKGENVDVREVITAGFDCLGSAGTAGTLGGTFGSLGTFGSFGDDDDDDGTIGPASGIVALSGKTPIE